MCCGRSDVQYSSKAIPVCVVGYTGNILCAWIARSPSVDCTLLRWSGRLTGIHVLRVEADGNVVGVPLGECKACREEG